MIRVLLLAILLLGPAAEAQIGVPRVRLPGLPIGVPGGLPSALGLAAGLSRPSPPTDELGLLEGARKALIAQLLRRHADVLEADPNGNPIVRGEVLALSPTDVALARGLGAGFTVLRERSFGALGIRVVVLGAPHGMATSRALTLLRRLDPGGTYDFNNVYTQSGATSSGRGAPPPAAGGLASAKATSLGLIDGGVATASPSSRAA